jgi:hypothetical protein
MSLAGSALTSTAVVDGGPGSWWRFCGSEQNVARGDAATPDATFYTASVQNVARTRQRRGNATFCGLEPPTQPHQPP